MAVEFHPLHIPDKPVVIPRGTDVHSPEYFKFVNGESASRNKISEQHPLMVIPVETMIITGDAVGQKEFIPLPDGNIIFDVQLHRLKGVNKNGH